jgi:hypothetical protein
MMDRENWPEKIPRERDGFYLNAVCLSSFEALGVRQQLRKLPIIGKVMLVKYKLKDTGQRLFCVYYKVM